MAEETYVPIARLMGPQGERGPRGDTGPAGPAGVRGTEGPQGLPGTIKTAGMTMLPPEAAPYVEMTGSEVYKHVQYFVPRGLPGASEVPADPAVAGYVGADDSETGQVLVQKYARRRTQVVNPIDFGAVGNGVADDTAAVQAAIDAMPYDGCLEITGKHLITEVVIEDKRRWTMHGSGMIVGGTVVIGRADSWEEMFFLIDGVTFDRAGAERLEGEGGIRLRLVRRGTIRNCRFIGMDRAVHVPAMTSQFFHATAMIKILNNEFSGVNHALYVGKHADATWMAVSDFKFIGNTVNVADIEAVTIDAIDGVVITNNVFFTSGADDPSPLKKANISIGESDWVIVTDNNLFEAGETGITLLNAKHVVVTGNTIAWPGQKTPSPGINIAGERVNGIVANNVIDQFTQHGIRIDAPGEGNLLVRDNAMYYDPDNPHYYGTTPLASVYHAGVWQSTRTTVLVTEEGNVCRTPTGFLANVARDAGTTQRLLGATGGVSGATVRKGVSATTDLWTLQGATGQSNAFAGLIHLEAKASDTSDSAASYLLMVSKTIAGGQVIVVAKQGLSEGTSATAPSFTFALNQTNELTVTKVGSTNSTFSFSATAMGDVRFAAST